MKYVLLTVVLIAACAAVSFLVSMTAGKKLRPLIRVLLSAAATIVLLAVSFFVYTGIFYHATDSAREYLQDRDGVKVIRIDEGYFFDGTSDDKAVIFYPGGKVEAEAYAPLMFQLAEKGYDCFLIRMPFNIPFFAGNRASAILNRYGYQKWYLMGHSLGGYTASGFATGSQTRISGLVLLASYPAKGLNEGMRVLSVYGSNDGCLDRDAYSNAMADCPADKKEFVIEGGNHSQFGDYGSQKGDGQASVTGSKQQRILVEKFTEWAGTDEDGQ